ncbi:glycosyltransferase family 4 protein [Curtobacterium flaccumfaciens]|nr:glycosyltransferase family 4 protein [Curtobacterium flaccumfaciens]
MNNPTRTGKIQLVIVADGDPGDERTNSGLPEGLLTGLRRRKDVDIVGLIDSTPSLFGRILAMALSFKVNSTVWRNVYRKGRVMRRLRSQKRDRSLSQYSENTVVIQVGNTYRPMDRSYAVVVDGTATLSQRWPAWSMPSAEFQARRRAELLQFSSATAIFTLGEQVRKEIIEVYDQPETKVFTLGGGIRCSEETSPQDEASSKVSRKTGTSILFIGVDFERKGGENLLEAFRELRKSDDVTLIIAGCQPREAEEGVEYTGFVADRVEIDSLYEEADIFCLPASVEPFGLVVREAMAFGLPCVVSDNGALPGLVGDGEAGLIVPAGNSAALRDSIQVLLRDPDLRGRLGERAKSLAGGAPGTP